MIDIFFLFFLCVLKDPVCVFIYMYIIPTGHNQLIAKLIAATKLIAIKLIFKKKFCFLDKTH